MANPTSFSNFTPLPFLYLLLLSFRPLPISSLNITDLLSSYPDLSDFTSLLATTAVAADLSARSSITLLAVPNAFLRTASAEPRPSSTNLADVLRYHVLLEYLSLSDLRAPAPTGKLVTTLFQTPVVRPRIRAREHHFRPPSRHFPLPPAPTLRCCCP
ncbi:UNVERIFIED_CONTAM: Fasciclin-like arabinogalactan protein 4 [Sesamum calycinum]|uniref:Fasciclin-like arabinogalactan protein 4 n=1 Tax=Sesamum calycinum TaxID=2727403 RepID=A0AAW2SCG5_9LAMI